MFYVPNVTPHSLYTAADTKIVIICEQQTVDNRITAGCVSSLCQFKFCLLISQACESTGYTVEYFGTSIQDIFLKTWKVGIWPVVCSFLLKITFRPSAVFFSKIFLVEICLLSLRRILRRFFESLEVNAEIDPNYVTTALQHPL